MKFKPNMMSSKRLFRGGFALALMLVVFVSSSSLASARISFGSPGSGAGQLDHPHGAAVDTSSGRLYVADEENYRVDVFGADRVFLYAFGWGVDDGISAEPQTCAVTCYKGLRTRGAGGFWGPNSVAVDNDPSSTSYHDVYVFDANRVQEFNPAGEFIRAWGGGVLTGGAVGKGDLTSGSAIVTNVATTQKRFLPGQEITGSGIPTGTKIAKIEVGPSLNSDRIILSDAAIATTTGSTLTVAEGKGNVPTNDVQMLTFANSTYNVNSFEGTFPLSFRFGYEDNGPEFTTPYLPSDATPAQVQSALAALPNIGAGNVSVTSPNPGGTPGVTGGPYTIIFKGTRFADTDVPQLVSSIGPRRDIKTVQNGASSFESCDVSNEVDCTGGIPGTGKGQFQGGDSITVGPDGVVLVGDGRANGELVEKFRVEKFDSSGTFLEEMPIPIASNELKDIAVDSSGNIYVAFPGIVGNATGDGVVRKYNATGSLLTEFVLSNLMGIGVDASDNLFATHLEGERERRRVISEFDAEGSLVRRFGYGELEENNDVVPYHTADGEVYTMDTSLGQIDYLSFPPPGPIACCVEATHIGNARATLNASVNPEGKAATYHFEYVDENSFEEEGGFGGEATKSTPEAALDSDFALHSLSAEVDVVPNKNYRYRVVANSADGNGSSEGQFKSLPPLEIGDAWSTEVSTDAAQLHAEVNPLGIPTTAYFEYLDDATYQADVQAGGAGHGFDHATKAPSAPIDLGSGETIKRTSTLIHPLDPNTIYHYRVVAEDPFITVRGDERMLRTFPRAGASAALCPNQEFRIGSSGGLPDCRAFEMVSPVNKNSNDIRVNLNAANFLAGLDWSSGSGSSFSYSSSSAFGGAPSSPWTSQYMAMRDPENGWSTHAISPQREPDSIFGAINVYLDLQYKAFSSDLSDGWLLHDTGPVLDNCAAAGFLSLYRRDDATGEYEALTTAPPSNEAADTYWPELRGFSADGTHAVFRANGKLTKDASAGRGYQLYEHVKGKNGCGTLRLVSVLPDGKAVTPFPSGIDTAEGRIKSVTNIISDDGSQIFWTADPGPLYLRIDGKETIQISPGAGAAHFRAASPDGSRVIFTMPQGGLSDLYEYEMGNPEATLVDSKVLGVSGVSQDASKFYFVSRNALAAGGEAGKPNLYLREAGRPLVFLATIAESDVSNRLSHVPSSLAGEGPEARGVRTTPDGAHLAFVSRERLTGYDNKDAVTGEPDLEVYLYDAGLNRLTCISCNPSSGRPEGRLFSEAGDQVRIAAELPISENQFSMPRALSEDGNKLFFNSYEALVPRDTNSRKDVYEWERSDDAKGCEEAGAELYAESAGGCLSLISSGQSPKDSEFDDASPDGSNVFIKTASSLLPQDDGLIDVYDAREGGGLPPPPGIPPACEGEACQGPPSPPNDPTPASSAFEGAGNVKEEAKGRKPGCAKGKAKRKGRCVAKNPHKKQATNHKRRAGR